MKLSDLLVTLGSEQLHGETVVREGAVVVSDVIIHDSQSPIERGQLVLAVGVDAGAPAAGDLVAKAAKAGAAAVAFRATNDPGPAQTARDCGVSILRVAPRLGWAQLVILVRTLISATAADPESHGERLAPSNVYGLADAIAALVGGSVVLYDRAHRVVAYSVQGYEIDSVRRDTILGRRTPDQWVEQFTADRSAYETFRRPDSVVRVDGYPGLRTRLRVVICSEGEILGEISVAEGQYALGQEAEAALLRAARLAVPFMLRHRLVEDTDRATRTRMLRGLLYGDVSSERHVAAELGLEGKAGFAVVGFGRNAASSRASSAAKVLEERVLHLLSLQMSSIDPAAGALLDGSTYYALIPTPSDGAHARIMRRVKPSLSQLEHMGVALHAAIGSWVPDLTAIPAARRLVDDLLHVAMRDTRSDAHRIVTVEDLWPELVLLPVERAIGGPDFTMCAQLQRLLEHDRRHRTDYLRTLRVYLEEFGSISKASERLVLHPNTLRHRLQRLGEISGLDIGDHTQRLAVGVQLRVLQVEGREEASPP
ncbi:helix-turn-helix domain-containing protein [Nonomuraea sp. NPDC050643]|uniref:PucR family transcriptional regulator n=1 Tax=Nonomuraea sp. NPDC050643 TaxID=3155660 RepID=UPI0033F7B358